MQVTLIDPNALDTDAAYFVSYNGLVNQETFQKEGLLTYQGWQYTAWYTSSRDVVVARRQVAGIGWELHTLDHQLSVDDAHNTISLGISPADGVLHIAMDCHNSEAFYATHTLTDPWDVWTPVGPMGLGSITYPQFVPTPEGLLQLLYRVGGSTNGALHLAEWDGTAWTPLGAFTSPTGNYSVPGWPSSPATKVSTSRNLYPHGIAYDSSGRLHLTGTWREQAHVTDPQGIANHDTLYVYSDDRGRTWRAGAQVAQTGTSSLVGITTPGIVVDAMPLPHYALINQESMAVDSLGRVHVAISYIPGRFTNAWTDDMCQDANTQRPVYGRLFHLRQTASGWAKTEIKPGGANLPIGHYGRSQIVVLPNNDILMVMPKLKMVAATAASGYTDWSVVYDGSCLNAFGEVLVSLAGDTLSVAYQTAGTPSALVVRDFQLGV